MIEITSIPISMADILVFGILFIIFVISFVLGFMFKGKVKILIFAISYVLFFSIPFLTALITNGYIYRAEFKDLESRKLVYINNYFVNGILTNKGKISLKECRIGIYINKKFPFQKPEYEVNLSPLKLNVGDSLEISETIPNFDAENIKYIKFRCF